MIQSDQHRGDWMGCAGAAHVATSALDSLAARGVVLNQAYCTYPLCGPSRMSFLTGMHPFRNGLHTNEESLASDRLTFAHALGLGGYHTVLCGRMHFYFLDFDEGTTRAAERYIADYAAKAAASAGPLARAPAYR